MSERNKKLQELIKELDLELEKKHSSLSTFTVPDYSEAFSVQSESGFMSNTQVKLFDVFSAFRKRFGTADVDSVPSKELSSARKVLSEHVFGSNDVILELTSLDQHVPISGSQQMEANAHRVKQKQRISVDSTFGSSSLPMCFSEFKIRACRVSLKKAKEYGISRKFLSCSIYPRYLKPVYLFGVESSASSKKISIGDLLRDTKQNEWSVEYHNFPFLPIRFISLDLIGFEWSSKYLGPSNEGEVVFEIFIECEFRA